MKSILLVTALMVLPAGAATIQLYQSGWDTGGPLTLTFAGIDANGDAGVDLAELTEFSARFGLPGGNFTSFELADIQPDGFFYGSADDYFIRADNGDYNLYETASPGSRLALFSDFSGSYVTFSGNSLQAVPEPATASALALGAALLVVLRWIGIRA